LDYTAPWYAEFPSKDASWHMFSILPGRPAKVLDAVNEPESKLASYAAITRGCCIVDAAIGPFRTGVFSSECLASDVTSI
jgi:hypothetical protein